MPVFSLPRGSPLSLRPSGLRAAPLTPTHISIEDLAVIFDLIGTVLIRYLTFFRIFTDIGRELLPLGEEIDNGRAPRGDQESSGWYPPGVATLGRGAL